jgi:hypothetical protein
LRTVYRLFHYIEVTATNPFNAVSFDVFGHSISEFCSHFGLKCPSDGETQLFRIFRFDEQSAVSDSLGKAVDV